MLLTLGTAWGQEEKPEKPLTEIPDEDAPILELKPLHTLKCEDCAVFSLVFSRDGKFFASGEGECIRVWNTHTGKEIHRITPPEKSGVFTLAISPNGCEIACVGTSGTPIHVFDLESGKPTRILDTFDTSHNTIVHLQFYPDGKSLAFLGGKTPLKKWDLETNKVVNDSKDPIEASDPKGGVLFSPDGKNLGVASSGKSLQLLDMATKKPVCRLQGLDDPKFQNKRLCYMAFSPSGQLFAAGELYGNGVRIWDTHSGEILWKLSWPRSIDPKQDLELVDRRRRTGVDAICFSSDGRTLRAVGSDGVFRVWEVATGKLRYRVQDEANGALANAMAAPFFATTHFNGSKHDRIVLWDSRTCVPHVRPSAPIDLDKTWAGLGSDNAATAFENMRILSGIPKEATALIEKRLLPVGRVSDAEIQKLISDLDDEEFEVRRKAQQRLREVSEVARGALTLILEGKPSEEVRKSIKSILDSTAAPPRGERIRAIRGVEFLETLGTSEARKILKACSEGEPKALLTREAKVALERLGRN
jgi:WD40 repeat protein